MMQNVVSKTLTVQDRMIPRFAVIEALEEPASAMADNADIALQYISDILVKQRQDGHLLQHKTNAACRVLGEVAYAAAQLRDATYSLMECGPKPAIEPLPIHKAARALAGIPNEGPGSHKKNGCFALNDLAKEIGEVAAIVNMMAADPADGKDDGNKPARAAAKALAKRLASFERRAVRLSTEWLHD
ncbi:MAG: hypothetical protein EOO81_08495 [Oxalobacteraceae bacterium]|nr:MAG: hypothetical protein EOO81_08495 [Oxalobacteraceae bacterium]